MRKEGDMIVFELAHREGDYVTIDEDGRTAILNLLSLASRRRRHALDKGQKSEWNEHLFFQDKMMTELFRSAKEIRVKVDWDVWYPMEKKINSELRRMNR